MRPVYLDYAATTPVDPRVIEKMQGYLGADGVFANPSSDHVLGHVAKHAVEIAREQVADLLHAEPSEIIWTSGATESNNLALKGAASLYERKGKHIITLKSEHKTVLDPCQYLEKQGFTVTYLSPESNGRLNLAKLEAAIRPDTILISMMSVNNELGVIQDLQAIAELSASRHLLLHVDAAQAMGKLELDVRKTPVDLVSLCAHKVYGPKGIGALYLRRKPRVRVAQQMHGGGQEQALRSGTLPTHQIVAMGEAFSLAKREWKKDYELAERCRQRFLAGIADLPHVLHSQPDVCVPHIVNLRFVNQPANVLLRQMPDLALSTASACIQSTSYSHVLRSIGLTEEESKCALRFSFGRFSTEAEVDFAIMQLRKILIK